MYTIDTRELSEVFEVQMRLFKKAFWVTNAIDLVKLLAEGNLEITREIKETTIHRNLPVVKCTKGAWEIQFAKLKKSNRKEEER